MKLNKLLIFLSVMVFMPSCSMDTATYWIEIDYHMATIPAIGGKAQIEVSASSSWDVKIEDGKEWISTNIEHSESLQATVIIEVDTANETGKERIGNVIIVSGESIRNVQVTQEFTNVDLKDCFGDWVMTEINAFKPMLNSTFTFNEDMTCKAHLFLPGDSERDVVGTYVFEGNRITITSSESDGTSKKIDIAVRHVTDTEMHVKVYGFPAKLTRDSK